MVAGDDKVNAAEKAAGVEVSGTAEAGARVDVTWGNTTKTVTATGGNWTARFASGEIPADGSTTISATATDAAGNASTPATRTVPVDTVAPVFASAAVNGSSLVLTYDSALSSGNPPVAGNFAVTVNSAARSVSSVNVSGSTVTLTLASPVASGDTITLAYTDPTAGDDVNAIQDTAGNDAASIPAQPVTNNTPAGPDLTPPTLVSATIDGDTLTLTYSEILNPAQQPAASYFSVTANGLNRAVDRLAISGNTVVVKLTASVSAGDSVVLNYNDPTTGNDSHAIQDAAGNDAASLTNQAVTNNTAGQAVSTSLVNATFTATSNASVSLVFNEAMQGSGLTTGVTLLMNGTGANILTGASISGNTLTYATNATLTALDFVQVIDSGSGDLRDQDNNPFGAHTLFIGGNDINTIDLSALTNLIYPVRVRGNDGDDTHIGSSGDDVLIGGGGADVINGYWGADNIFLSEPVRACDTVKVLADGPNSGSLPYHFDRVFGFDVSGNSTNDKLDLPSGQIAANVSNADGWFDVGVFARHSISNGILTFRDNAGNPITIHSGNLDDATTYLINNLPYGHAVGFEADTDGSGYADSLFVFQRNHYDPNNPWSDVLIRLTGVTGATLGNTAAQNVVQIVDSTGPNVIDAEIMGSGVYVFFNEALASWDYSGLVIQKGLGTSRSDIDIHSTVIINDATPRVRIVTNTTFATGEYALVRVPSGTGDTATDLFGNTSKLSTLLGVAGIAIGGMGDSNIDLSDLSGNYLLYDGMMGNDTLIGGWGDDKIIAGEGNDVLIGNGGDDELVGGTGADRLKGGAGADRYVFIQGDSTPVSFQDKGGAGVSTGDTYTFSGGADVITGGFDVSGPDGDRIVIMSGRPGSGMTYLPSPPANGLVGDQQYFLVRGSYDTAIGVFTVNTNNGTDTLLVYDGDRSAGVSQTALVVRGITPNKLAYSGGGLYYNFADPTPPNPLVSATFSGSSLTLTFSKAVTADNWDGLSLTRFELGILPTPIGVTDVNGLGTDTLNLTLSQSLNDTDLLRLRYEAGTLRDLAGNDLAAWENWIGGNEGNMIYFGGYHGDLPITAYGNDGRDNITGSSSDDWLYGGSGNDNINGSHGADTLSGGSGYDGFYFQQGDSPEITAMNLGEDRMLSNGDTFILAIGTDLIIDFSGDYITLPGIIRFINAPDDGLAVDQSLFFVQGSYNANSGVFTVDSEVGDSTLIVWDGNRLPNEVIPTSIVISNVVPEQLNTTFIWPSMYIFQV